MLFSNEFAGLRKNALDWSESNRNCELPQIKILRRLNLKLIVLKRSSVHWLLSEPSLNVSWAWKAILLERSTGD